MKSQKRIKILVALAFAIIFMTSAYLSVSAQLGIPFGGFVFASIPCTCAPGQFLLTLGLPSPGQYTYFIGTPQFANYQLPRAGVWALGLASPGSPPCLQATPKGCIPIGLPSKTITPTVGTSL